MSYDAIGDPLLREGPKIISKGWYKLVNGAEIHIGEPVALNDAPGGANYSDANDGNKVWVKPYDAADSSALALGVALYEKPSGGTESEYAGMGGLRRDLAVLLYGPMEMQYVGTAQDIAPGTKIAPAPGGFIVYDSAAAPAQTILGYTLEPIYSGATRALVMINPGGMN